MNNGANNEENNEESLVQLRLVESKIINTEIFYETENLVKGTELTWWDCFGGIERAQDFEDTYHIDLTLSDVDLSKENLLISIGRDIVEVKSEKSEIAGSAIPLITFSDVYEDGKLYVYAYTGECFPPNYLDYCMLYIKEGDNVRFWGSHIRDINTRVPIDGEGAK